MEDMAAADAGFEHKKKGWKQTNDMSQTTIDLFRKYLLSKPQNHNVGKTNEEESEALKKKLPPRALIPLLPPKFASAKFSRRPPSFLEQELLPGIRCNEIRTNSTGVESSKAQLTIFYAGVINVYDNVPTDKAQAIMLLAGESSLPKPIANEKPKTDSKAPLHPPNVESSCKLQAGLPIARKISLQHFLAKRRHRIGNNSPYAPTANKDEEKLAIRKLTLENKNSKDNNHSISLSPLPSRIGYFLPVAANKGCQA
ncbi:protein TIFY 9-like [Herrania umbratica]|uniref:Protein TIFY n=1 Tax=Herrania umbratica TaxID=108875 RepID=A0A6J1AJA4_9ROSI|nr:protein TIFY 9-like [Herrania umbratica]